MKVRSTGTRLHAGDSGGLISCVCVCVCVCVWCPLCETRMLGSGVVDHGCVILGRNKGRVRGCHQVLVGWVSGDLGLGRLWLQHHLVIRTNFRSPLIGLFPTVCSHRWEPGVPRASHCGNSIGAISRAQGTSPSYVFNLLNGLNVNRQLSGGGSLSDLVREWEAISG